MNTPVLKTENLTHVYSPGTPFMTTAIEGISISVDKGDFIAIVGHTGSGKSTLLQHLNGLLKPTSGKVLLDGQDIYADKRSVRQASFKVGLVFQYPEYQLFEETVRRDIAFGPKNMGLSDREIEERVLEAARFTGIPEGMLEQSPFDLSGGQKRRVAIAGVIAMRPEVLVLDEPMAGLDPQGRKEVMENITAYHDASGAAVVMVTHSMDDAAEYARRIIVLEHGRVLMEGTPTEVFSRGEELIRTGLGLPAATEIAEMLRARGFELPAGIYTAEQARDAVLALAGLKKGGTDNA